MLEVKLAVHLTDLQSILIQIEFQLLVSGDTHFVEEHSILTAEISDEALLALNDKLAMALRYGEIAKHHIAVFEVPANDILAFSDVDLLLSVFVGAEHPAQHLPLGIAHAKTSLTLIIR